MNKHTVRRVTVSFPYIMSTFSVLLMYVKLSDTVTRYGNVWNRSVCQLETKWRTADEFYERTNFPNCMGAVDGNHTRMRKPNGSGSQFFNCKNFFSTIIMAMADADYCFISVEAGAQGSSSDSNVFKNSTFGKLLESNKLNIPDPRQKDYPCHLYLWVKRRSPYQSMCYCHIPTKSQHFWNVYITIGCQEHEG